MKIQSSSLIDDLIGRIDKVSKIAETFRELNPTELNARKSADSWSLLECIEHLNRYGHFYLPEIEKQLSSQTPHVANGVFESGILGNYLVNLIKPEPVKKKKMRTAKEMNPIHSRLDERTLLVFFEQLHALRLLIEKSATVDLSKVHVKTSLSRLIRLRLGDILRFMVHHIERHIQQAQATQS
ncbi:DinB family protein [Flavobacterium selenitireducens]|uniref:DinB family protein n=1 Tax=Flavobacterium selenitireducens TaxID=2722704 RepID=UPI00168B02EF|nr:DinB family protein [Flavobacterium selenitireducens]MBD3581707.1 DinB family protein [Flavobacterium selenitireducens]